MLRPLILLLIVFLQLPISIQAQTKVVKGIVTSTDDGSTLVGVNVVVKGTFKGTTTDLDGAYTISLEAGEDALVFSYIGYITQTIQVGTQTQINVALVPDTELLPDVVVVGYGIQKKSDLTGSVTSVRGSDLVKIPSSSPEQALQGKVAGVQVSSASGAPGSVPIVRIRGVGTLNNAAPIYVVDGVILEDISFLSSADIESMDILKDASATAIYGSRGANGVIMITTKMGKVSTDASPTISVSSEVSVQHLSKKIDLLSGKEFAQIVNVINPGTYNNIDAVKETDWQDEVFKTLPLLQNHHISLMGASGKYSYYLGLGAFLQDGIVPKSSYKRYSLKLNNTYAVTDNIKLGINITASPESKENEAGVIGMAYRAWPSSVPFLPDGSFAEVGGAGNPLAAIEYNNSTNKRLRVVGNGFAEIKFLKHFLFRSSYGIDLIHSKDKSFTPAYFVNSSQSNALNDLSIKTIDDNNWLLENTLTYNAELGDHQLNLLGGVTAQKNTRQEFSASIQNLIGDDPDLWYLEAGDPNYLIAGNNGDITSIASYLFRTNYTFKSRYLLTASYRIDGSSKFGPENRWGYFPSFALGWNLMNEAFMGEVQNISKLKLRGSWGIIGNEKINWRRQYSLVSNNQNTVFGTAEDLAIGATYGVSGNPAIQWENTTQTDIGLELGLLKDKLSAEFDYYHRITDGILVELQTPGHMGNGPFATVTFNAAEVLNSGLETALSWKDNIGNMKYAIGANFTTIHNEVLKLGATTGVGSFISAGPLGNGQLITRTEVGQPIGAFYGYQVAGVFQNTTELENSPKILGQTVGDLKFADLNNDGIIDDKDRTFIGSYIPDFIYGFNLNLGYKNFDLLLDFNGQAGNEIYNGKNAVRPDLYNFEAQTLDHWNGENSSNTEPRPTAGGYNYEPSDYFIQSGSFFRLRSITLNYNLPQNLLERIKTKDANIYLRGTNVFTLSPYTGYTPEIANSNALASGIDSGIYPITAIYSLGINVSF